VSSAVEYARCPRQCYWSVVDPRPRSAGAAALVGSDVHKWIERLARRQPSLLDEIDHLDDLDDLDDLDERERVAALQRSFLATPFAAIDPVVVERTFALPLGALVIRGRVDAVYEREGRYELVDFKTGRPPAPDDGGASVQLDLYALAAVDVWRRDPSTLRTTYCYLGRGELVTRDFHQALVDDVRERLETLLARFSAGRFPTRPGSYCGHCDFAGFCPAAQI
jgi:DNA helicase-2/ATP-dependent DNA helicase PcrA